MSENIIKRNPLNLQFSRSSRIADIEWLTGKLEEQIETLSIEIEILYTTLEITSEQLVLYKTLESLIDSKIVEVNSLEKSIDKLDEELNSLTNVID